MKLKYSKFNKAEIVDKSDKVFIPPPPRKKTIIETIMAPWRPVSSLDSGSASISLPPVPARVLLPPAPVRILQSLPPPINVNVAQAPAPPEVKPIPIYRQSKVPLTVIEPDIPKVEKVIPGSEPGSRAWRRKIYKLTNFI